MAGEMLRSDLEPGGEFFEVRRDLERLCRKAGVPCTVKPFDRYQGPYADVGDGLRVFCQDDTYFIDQMHDHVAKVVFEGGLDATAQRLKVLKGQHLKLVKGFVNRVCAKYRLRAGRKTT